MKGTLLQISKINTSGRIRGVNESQVLTLVKSIEELETPKQSGLLHPISVVAEENGYRLVAGLHRIEAFKRLGKGRIPAVLIDLDEMQRVIAECDENLCGTVLTSSERALFTTRRKAAYEALHPEAQHGAIGNGREKSRQIGDSTKTSNNNNIDNSNRFTKDTSEKTGQSERTIQRDAERGEKITEEALEAVKGTDLDKGVYLDKLKKVEPEKQVETVKVDLEAAKQPAKPKAEKKPSNGLSNLTREALEDEILGLRRESDHHRKELQRAKAENDKLREENADLKSENQGAVISKLQSQLNAAKFARDEALTKAKRSEFKMKQAERERDEARKTLENQMVRM